MAKDKLSEAGINSMLKHWKRSCRLGYENIGYSCKTCPDYQDCKQAHQQLKEIVEEHYE